VCVCVCVYTKSRFAYLRSVLSLYSSLGRVAACQGEEPLGRGAVGLATQREVVGGARAPLEVLASADSL